MTDNSEPTNDDQSMEKFRLENGVLHVLINLYPYLLHEFDGFCQRLLRFPNRNVCIDLSDCDFVSTVFLSTMIRTHLEAQRNERKLVVRIGPSLEHFFGYAGFDKTFNIENLE